MFVQIYGEPDPDQLCIVVCIRRTCGIAGYDHDDKAIVVRDFFYKKHF